MTLSWKKFQGVALGAPPTPAGPAPGRGWRSRRSGRQTQDRSRKNGYVVLLDKAKLEKAPHYAERTPPAYDRKYGETVYDYYGVILP